MNKSTAIAEIRRGLGYRTTLETTIVGALASVQRTLERGGSLPDWLIVYDAEITVTADDPGIALPANFLRMHDDFDLYYTDSDEGRVRVPKRNDAEARDAYASVTDAEYARVWVPRGRTAGILVPTPTASATYYLTYYKKADDIGEASVTTNEWMDNVPDLMVGLAGLEVMGAARDKDAQLFFQQRVQRGQRTLLGDIVDGELAGRPLIMGRNN